MALSLPVGAFKAAANSAQPARTWPMLEYHTQTLCFAAALWSCSCLRIQAMINSVKLAERMTKIADAIAASLDTAGSAE